RATRPASVLHAPARRRRDSRRTRRRRRHVRAWPPSGRCRARWRVARVRNALPCRADCAAGRGAYPSRMALYRLDDVPDLVGPVLVAALEGWVDAGSAGTTAARQLADDGQVVVTFDSDAIYDYRARRPTLDIMDGRPR